MTENRRADDPKIEQILKILDRLDKELWGNGHPGLLKEHEVVKEKICQLEGIENWIKGSVLVLLLSIFSFIFGYGQIYNKVNLVEKMIMTHVEKGG